MHDAEAEDKIKDLSKKIGGLLHHEQASLSIGISSLMGVAVTSMIIAGFDKEQFSTAFASVWDEASGLIARRKKGLQ